MAVGSAVCVGVGVSVGVSVGVGVSVRVGVGVLLGMGVMVGVSVTLAVWVAAMSTRGLQAPATRENKMTKKIICFFMFVYIGQSQGVVYPWNSLYTSGRLSLE